jgi:hypothetical protein
MTRALRLLIISGPYEGERLRRAATARGLTVELAESLELFEIERTAERPDAVLLTTGVLAPAQAGALDRLRARIGPGVPLVVFGDPEAADAARRSADLFVPRPMSAEELVESVRVRLTDGPAQSRQLVAGLEPLRSEPSRTVGALAPQVADLAPTGRTLDRLAASIDETLDAELLAVARTAVDRPLEDLTDATVAAQASGLVTADGIERRLGQVQTPQARSDRPSGLSPSTAVRRGAGPWAGDLADTDLPMLLGRAFAEATTGRLRVRREAVEKAIFFESGRPVLATSNAVEDRMIEMFLRQGRITQAQHDRAVQDAAETGRRMGALLVDLGIMKSVELLSAVREHYEEIIFSLFAWESGSWAFEPGVVADARRIRLLRHPAALVSAGLRRSYPLSRMKERLGSARNVFVVQARGSALDILTEIGVDADERRVPLLFDGVRSFEEIVRVSGLPEETVYRVTLALWALRLLVSASTPAGAAVGPQTRDLEIERARILERFALAKEGDYFQVLGVDRNADGAEIRRACEHLGRELSAEAVGAELGQELHAELSVIREVLGEAARVLGDEALRTRYREAAPRPGQGQPSATGGAEKPAGS